MKPPLLLNVCVYTKQVSSNNKQHFIRRHDDDHEYVATFTHLYWQNQTPINIPLLMFTVIHAYNYTRTASRVTRNVYAYSVTRLVLTGKGDPGPIP